MNKIYDWYKLLLSIFFWIFLWDAFDLILDEMNLTKRNKLFFYVTCTLIIAGLITYDKSFFK